MHICRGSNAIIPEHLSVITTNNMTFLSLDILLFVFSDTIIIWGLSVTYQPKSPLLRDETVYTARNINMQHANMSSENNTGHFTWFLNVLHAFLADSELLWARFFCINQC